MTSIIKYESKSLKYTHIQAFSLLLNLKNFPLFYFNFAKIQKYFENKHNISKKNTIFAKK